MKRVLTELGLDVEAASLYTKCMVHDIHSLSFEREAGGVISPPPIETASLFSHTKCMVHDMDGLSFEREAGDAIYLPHVETASLYPHIKCMVQNMYSLSFECEAGPNISRTRSTGGLTLYKMYGA